MAHPTQSLELAKIFQTGDMTEEMAKDVLDCGRMVTGQHQLQQNNLLPPMKRHWQHNAINFSEGMTANYSIYFGGLR